MSVVLRARLTLLSCVVVVDNSDGDGDGVVGYDVSVVAVVVIYVAFVVDAVGVDG